MLPLMRCAGGTAADYHGALPRHWYSGGLIRGHPPWGDYCAPAIARGAGALCQRLLAISKKRNRKAEAEFEILKYTLKLGEYKWL
jgi:hypothetical protein